MSESMTLNESLKLVTSALKLEYLMWSLKACHLAMRLVTVNQKSCFMLQSSRNVPLDADLDLDLVGFGSFLFGLVLVNDLLSLSHVCCFPAFFYRTEILGGLEERDEEILWAQLGLFG